MRQVPKTKWRNGKIKSKWLVIIILATMAVLVHPGLVHSAKAQATSETWVNTYSSGSTPFSEPGGATSVQQTTDGGFILVGHTFLSTTNNYNAWVVRLDSSGNVVWENSYGGTDNDFANSVQQTSDGGFIVAGATSSFGSRTENAWLLRLDGDGNVLWENAYGGNQNDYANSVQQTSDGGFIVAGSNRSFGTGSNAWILRLDEDGRIIWENAYGIAQHFSVAADVQQTSDGRFIVAGWSFPSSGNPLEPFGAWVFLLDGDGNVEWQHLYVNASIQGDCIDFANSVQQTTDGGYILATGCDATILRLDSDGNIVWTSQYSLVGSSFTSGNAVRLTADGGFVAAGEVFSTNTGQSQAWVAKLDSDGQVGSQCSFITSVSGTTQSDTAATVAATSSTVTDTSTLDTVTPTTSNVADTSSTDTTSLICQG